MLPGWPGIPGLKWSSSLGTCSIGIRSVSHCTWPQLFYTIEKSCVSLIVIKIMNEVSPWNTSPEKMGPGGVYVSINKKKMKVSKLKRKVMDPDLIPASLWNTGMQRVTSDRWGLTCMLQLQVARQNLKVPPKANSYDKLWQIRSLKMV